MSEEKDDLGVFGKEEVEAEFTEGEEQTVLGGGKQQKKVTPKVTDVPFEMKEPKADEKAEEGERYKQILLDLGFHKKQNGDEKAQYVKKEGDIVIGRTFTEKLPTGKFWAIQKDNFLKEEEVKKLEIVRAFYDVRDGKKKIEDVAQDIAPELVQKDTLMPATIEAALTPKGVINESQGMANALYQVVEKQHLYMDIGGKKYLQLEAWQLLGKFCNMHGIVEKVQPVEYFGVTGFEATAVVKDSEGVVVAAAQAICMTDEPNWKDKPLFQLKSMSQSRALSKAYRSCLSFIVALAGYSATPAEEMVGM